jgi:GH35 family endo-1,4-beta-xylanase
MAESDTCLNWMSVTPDGKDLILPLNFYGTKQKSKGDVKAYRHSQTIPACATFWGVLIRFLDTGLVKRKDWPLLYDYQYQPKPAYQDL